MRKLLNRLVLAALSLQMAACSQPISIMRPFDASKANQSSVAQFTVKKTGDYLFGLMFTTAEKFPDIYKQEEIYGSPNKDGIPIDIHLTIQRNDSVIHDDVITTTGVQWGKGFQIDNRHISTLVRLISIVELHPGNYIIEIKTTKETKEFKDIETHTEFTFYNPKH